ncbi:MAG TPA: hypothetical protein GX525_01125 [Bacilli bacterium]|nr:hypothetical protein [Bacilli bacterium]
MKRRKITGALLFALLGVFVTGCSLSGEALSPPTIVINENVELESSLADSYLELTREADLTFNQAITFRELSKIDEKYALYNQKNRFYKYDFENGSMTKLVDKEISTISEDGTKALAITTNAAFVYHLDTMEEKKIDVTGKDELFFVDKKGDFVGYFDSAEATANIIDVNTNRKIVYELDNYFTVENMMISKIIMEGDSMYLSIHTQKDGYNIYKIDANKQAKALLPSTKNDILLADFDVLADGRVIFDGFYGEGSGLFLFNPNNKQVKQLIAGGKDSEGKWTPSFKLSPDGTKIMFDMPVQVMGKFKTNIYMAELHDEKVVNSMRILEQVDTPAVISIVGFWSADSTTALIALSDEDAKEYDRTIVEQIAVFKLQ